MDLGGAKQPEGWLVRVDQGLACSCPNALDSGFLLLRHLDRRLLVKSRPDCASPNNNSIFFTARSAAIIAGPFGSPTRSSLDQLVTWQRDPHYHRVHRRTRNLEIIEEKLAGRVRPNSNLNFWDLHIFASIQSLNPSVYSKHSPLVLHTD